MCSGCCGSRDHTESGQGNKHAVCEGDHLLNDKMIGEIVLGGISYLKAEVAAKMTEVRIRPELGMGGGLADGSANSQPQPHNIYN